MQRCTRKLRAVLFSVVICQSYDLSLMFIFNDTYSSLQKEGALVIWPIRTIGNMHFNTFQKLVSFLFMLYPANCQFVLREEPLPQLLQYMQWDLHIRMQELRVPQLFQISFYWNYY